MAALLGPPFGLAGFLKARPLSGEAGHLLALETVTLRQGGGERTVRVEKSALGPGGSLLLKFAGVDTPEAARTFTGAELVVDRAHAAPLRPGEFYVEDLKGLEVRGPEGEVLGRLTDVLEGGGGQLAEVTLPSGERRLAPFREEFFGEIRLEAGWAELREPWVLE